MHWLEVAPTRIWRHGQGHWHIFLRALCHLHQAQNVFPQLGIFQATFILVIWAIGICSAANLVCLFSHCFTLRKFLPSFPHSGGVFSVGLALRLCSFVALAGTISLSVFWFALYTVFMRRTYLKNAFEKHSDERWFQRWSMYAAFYLAYFILEIQYPTVFSMFYPSNHIKLNDYLNKTNQQSKSAHTFCILFTFCFFCRRSENAYAPWAVFEGK